MPDPVGTSVIIPLLPDTHEIQVSDDFGDPLG